MLKEVPSTQWTIILITVFFSYHKFTLNYVYMYSNYSNIKYGIVTTVVIVWYSYKLLL